MGLDMYLKAERHLWSFNQDDNQIKTKIAQALGDVGDMEVSSVRIEALYWRKANAIHRWFVENVQNGIDQCQESYVERDKLQELLNTVNTVLQHPEQAAELLPAQEGFFFGSTNYDGYYWETLNDTKAGLETILGENYERYEFYYRASW